MKPRKTEGADIAQAWREYKKTKKPELREQMVLRYSPLVKMVAGRMAMTLPPNVEIDDLIGFGVLGLLDAIEKFDPSRGVRFETYAVARIKGAILDGLRSTDWVPSSVRQKARELEQTYAEMESRLGRPPTDQEVAQALGLSREELDSWLMEVSRSCLVSLEDLRFGEAEEGEGFDPLERIVDPNAEDPVRKAEWQDVCRLLGEAIDKLPDKERLVIALYYYEGMTVREIAQTMGLSQSRISQLHGKAILRLRGRLARLKYDLVG